MNEHEREIIQSVIDDYDAACDAGYDEEKWGAFGGVEALRELLSPSVPKVVKLWTGAGGDGRWDNPANWSET